MFFQHLPDFVVVEGKQNSALYANILGKISFYLSVMYTTAMPYFIRKIKLCMHQFLLRNDFMSKKVKLLHWPAKPPNHNP